jgi:hypothetical protein
VAVAAAWRIRRESPLAWDKKILTEDIILETEVQNF